jgi:UDP:flavonoid glycosyltransferase YjiC (YdhE family)
VYPGSAATGHQRFVDGALAACAALTLPTVLIAPMAESAQVAGASRTTASLQISWAPMEMLLRRARVIIHHGGIGTCAQALAHRVPQLILASAYDQFENGERISRMGGGRWCRLPGQDDSRILTALNQALRCSVTDAMRIVEQEAGNWPAPSTEAFSNRDVQATSDRLEAWQSDV